MAMSCCFRISLALSVAVRFEQRAAKLFPDNLKARSNVAFSHCYLESACQKTGKLQEALEHLRQAAEIRKHGVQAEIRRKLISRSDIRDIDPFLAWTKIRHSFAPRWACPC